MHPAGGRIRLEIAYDGSDFAGWQRQPGRDTIQSRVEQALRHLYRSEARIPVTAAGRTDAGVHAEGQVAHFDAPRAIPPEGIVAAGNAVLPEAIRILRAAPAAGDFHARFQAKAKTYRYDFLTGPRVSPLASRFGWPVGTLDTEAMEAAAQAFLGEHDFRAFFTAAPDERPASPMRTVLAARIEQKKDRVRFEVTASGFWRYMVRRMAGTLSAVGRGRIPAARVREMLEDPDAPGPRFRAPARGLCLMSVRYPEPER